MWLGKENIPLLRSFDDLSDSGSINIWSLRDRQESRQQRTITQLLTSSILIRHKTLGVSCRARKQR